MYADNYARLRAGVIAITAIAAGLLAAASAGAASNGQIAVVDSDSSVGLSAIALIPTDRLATLRNSKLLVSGPGMIGNLQWTTDGKTLVYDETVGMRTDLYAIEVASPKRRLLVTRLPSVNDGALSPDGKTVAYSQGNGSAAAVYLVGTDGQSRRKLTNGFEPVWSPDGSHLALLTTTGEIETIGADGSGLHSAAHVSRTVLITSLAWAPDGKSFLVVTQDYTHYTTVVETIASNGSVLHVLSKTGGFPSASSPAATWSPNGTQVAFTSTSAGNRKSADRQTAVIANADGSSPHIVDTATGAERLELSWSPDGRSIVTADGDRVRVIGADGTQAKVIAYPGSEHLLDDPAWQPVS